MRTDLFRKRTWQLLLAQSVEQTRAVLRNKGDDGLKTDAACLRLCHANTKLGKSDVFARAMIISTGARLKEKDPSGSVWLTRQAAGRGVGVAISMVLAATRSCDDKDLVGFWEVGRDYPPVTP